MATITEDFVSFETAKLLKEKNCPDFGYSCICDSEGNRAQTQSIIMKWLREVHNIFIDISPTYSEVEKTIHFIWQIFDSNYDYAGDCEIFYGKYETACEAAIKYCLENLI